MKNKKKNIWEAIWWYHHETINNYFKTKEIPIDKFEVISKIGEILKEKCVRCRKLQSLSPKEVSILLEIFQEAEKIIEERRANYAWHGESTI